MSEEKSTKKQKLRTSKLPHASKEENVVNTQKIINHTGLLTVKNIMYTVSFLLLFGIIWHISAYVTITTLETTLTYIQLQITAKYLALLSALISWLLVGRKIQVGQTIPRILNWLLLGPLNYIRFKKLNLGQHKVLWIGFILIVFLILFPPWDGYSYPLDYIGCMDEGFVGCHFVLSTKYDVLYDAPYIIAEIDHKIQLIMIASVLVCSFSSIFFLAKKPVKSER